MLQSSHVKTTVLTPTTGDQRLRQAIASVQEQTTLCNHLIVVDGMKHMPFVRSIIESTGFYGDVITLPENTGKDYRGTRWNGHRIYSAIPRLVNTPYVCFLDQDNWYEPEFVENCESYIRDGGRSGVFTLRNIYAGDRLIGVDNTNTMFFDTYQYSRYISESFYNPLGADKVVAHNILRTPHFKYILIRKALVNYAPERLWEFFTQNIQK